MQPKTKAREGFRAKVMAVCNRGSQLVRLLPRPQRRTLVLALLVTLVTSATVNAVPVLLGGLVNALQSSQERGTIATEWLGLALVYLGIALAVFVAREGLQLFFNYLARKLCTRVEKDMTVAVLTRLLRANLRLFSADKIGTLQARVTHGVDAFVTLLKLGLQDLAPALFTVGCVIAYALYSQVEVGILLLVAIPSTLLLAAWQTRVQKGTRLAVVRAEEGLGGTLVEQFSGIEYLRAANTHDREIERVTRVAEERQRQEFRQQIRAALFEALKALNDWLFLIAVITCAVVLTLSGHTRIGSTLTFWYLCFYIITPLREMYRIFDQAHESYLRVDDLQALLREPPDQSFAGDGKSVERGAPSAEWEPHLGKEVPLVDTKGVVVEYRTASGQKKRALDGVSVKINFGEVVGIAGASGSGKSTLVKLLLRLVHPAAGEAILGGVPLEAVSREALGRLVGYVGQEPFLFTGTVAENIAYGRDGASAADIRRAAELADLHDDILRLPGGYGAAVGERGRNLSGGQRQRLALARVLLYDPPVLFLDEATSALDPATERRVLRSLVAGRGSRTVLWVAHRPSALRAADRVLVFADGRLVEDGTYPELLRRAGIFGELVQHSRETESKQSAGMNQVETKGRNGLRSKVKANSRGQRKRLLVVEGRNSHARR